VKKKKLIKLPQDVVNQIAAGEVVERPASIVKELVDNAIDAEAGKITVKVKNGGIDMIEVSDDGYGIPRNELSQIFDAHTTSKIESIEDLNTLLSMGFRGEALSTITSVARVEVSSKYVDEEFGNEITFTEEGKSKVKKTAKEEGTTVRVENIFYNIPARKKYLKTAQTEYRKIYELLNNYYLIYPNIHFVLEKNGRIVVNLKPLPKAKQGEIVGERVKEVLNEDPKDFLKLFYDGSGVKISGFVAHPSLHRSTRVKGYIFINNRPITDKGIYRAIYEGYSRYLPHGEKVDFAINIQMDPKFVDINVHPRKEEVRFENPYRIYSAIEEAVRHTLEKELSFEDTSSKSQIKDKHGKETSGTDFTSMREKFNKKSNSSTSSKSKQYMSPNTYKKAGSVKDSLLFSKELLSSQPSDLHTQADKHSKLLWEEEFEIRNLFQIFNKYIVVEFVNEKLWIIDQHAAAERINFEKLSKGKQGLDLQNYLVPVEMEFKKEEILFLEETKEFFEEMGIVYEIKDKAVVLETVPTAFSQSDFEKIFEEIFSLEDDIKNLKKNFKKLREDILAIISCHTSVRSGQRLERETMFNLFKELSECENPYSCPHGRPAVWKMTLSEIDKNFERTY
jgi:DNA mismatch repair protein MutL